MSIQRKDVRGTVEELAARVTWCVDSLPPEVFTRFQFVAFFDREFYESATVALLGPTGEGAYIKAIVLCFHSDYPGSITAKQLERIIRLYCLDENQAAEIRDAFDLIDGKLWNRGALKSWIFAARDRIAGRRGGKGTPEAKALASLAVEIIDGTRQPPAEYAERFIAPSSPHHCPIIAPSLPVISPKDGDGMGQGSRSDAPMMGSVTKGKRKEKEKEEEGEGDRRAGRSVGDAKEAPPVSRSFEEFRSAILPIVEDAENANGSPCGFLAGDMSKARTAWVDLESRGELPPTHKLIDKVREHANSAQWVDDWPKYVPKLENWLKGRKFEEVKAPAKVKKPTEPAEPWGDDPELERVMKLQRNAENDRLRKLAGSAARA